MKLATLILVLLWGFLNNASAQSAKATISIMGEEKQSYLVGDSLQVQILINISPEICSDGMDKTKTYLSGLDIIETSKWVQKDERHWEKQMQLLIRKNKKGRAKITVFRKADKGDFFVQKKISVVE